MYFKCVGRRAMCVALRDIGTVQPPCLVSRLSLRDDWRRRQSVKRKGEVIIMSSSSSSSSSSSFSSSGLYRFSPLLLFLLYNTHTHKAFLLLFPSLSSCYMRSYRLRRRCRCCHGAQVASFPRRILGYASLCSPPALWSQ